MKLDLVIASGNPGKVKEIKEVMGHLPVMLLTSADTGDWGPIDETGDTFLENALIKARAVMQHTGRPALADDSGLEVDALDGQPGVWSARFAGENASDEQNNAKMAALMKNVPSDRRTARYRCVVALVMPDGREFAAVGTCEGRIGDEPRGSGGFGYDPWFVPEGDTRTMAELPAEQKHAISHRGKALRGITDQLERHLGLTEHGSST